MKKKLKSAPKKRSPKKLNAGLAAWNAARKAGLSAKSKKQTKPKKPARRKTTKPSAIIKLMIDPSEDLKRRTTKRKDTYDKPVRAPITLQRFW